MKVFRLSLRSVLWRTVRRYWILSLHLPQLHSTSFLRSYSPSTFVISGGQDMGFPTLLLYMWGKLKSDIFRMCFIIFIECTDRWMFTPTFSVCAGNRRCAPKLASVNVTIGNCSSVTLMPVCQGQCASEQRWDRNNNNNKKTNKKLHFTWISDPPCVFLWLWRVVFEAILQVEQMHQSCQKQSSERRSLSLRCQDLTTRTYDYEHITACICRECHI